MPLHLLEIPENVEYFRKCVYKYSRVTGLPRPGSLLPSRGFLSLAKPFFFSFLTFSTMFSCCPRSSGSPNTTLCSHWFTYNIAVHLQLEHRVLFPLKSIFSFSVLQRPAVLCLKWPNPHITHSKKEIHRINRFRCVWLENTFLISCCQRFFDQYCGKKLLNNDGDQKIFTIILFPESVHWNF